MSTNLRNPAIRRIMADMQELRRHQSSRYHAAPLEDNHFEWHFTIRGPEGSDFAEGVYHGRIILPAEYPMKPPNIVFLTKNGRFEVGTKICLSISAYHEETWQPAWGVRTMLEAIISFLPSEGAGAVGALDYTPAERKKLAEESKSYRCPHCGDVCALLPVIEGEEKFDNTIVKQVAQLRMSRPSLSRDQSGKLNTSGALDDLPPHHSSVHGVAQVTLNGLTELPLPDAVPGQGDAVQREVETLCAAEMNIVEEMANLAVERIENDRDADGTLADLLDMDVLGKRRAAQHTLHTQPTQPTQALQPVPSTEPDPSAAATHTPTATAELRHRAAPQPTAAAAAVAVPVAAPPAPAQPAPGAAAARPAPPQGSLLLSVVDLCIMLTMSVILYIGSGVVSRNM